MMGSLGCRGKWNHCGRLSVCLFLITRSSLKPIFGKIHVPLNMMQKLIEATLPGVEGSDWARLASSVLLSPFWLGGFGTLKK